jgi:hypothetical protein
MLNKYSKIYFGITMFLILPLSPTLSYSSAIDYETAITFDTFPDGTPIFTNSSPYNSYLKLSDQFQSLGVIFENLYPGIYGGPSVIATQTLGNILISGGPTGFFGDIRMDFVGPLVTNFVTIDIVGSGLSIGASLTAFGHDGEVLDSITHYYYGTTGIPSAMTIITPPGREIESILFNGGLNPSAAASIATLEFGRTTPVPEPSTMLLLGSGLLGLLGFRKKFKM